MGIDETIIEEIIKRVLKVAQPERIILFGSAATGEMTRDSDIDLLVLLKTGGKRKAAHKKADELNLLTTARYGNPVSVNIYTEAEYSNNGLDKELKKRIMEEGLFLIER